MMKDDNIPTVSIVIICMNNLKNLYPCLQSIRKYTHVSYECFVVAYLFTKENLEKVRNDFPWVKFIESNEIRGFSENNNLALRQAKGKYCWVVNDDTEMRMSVIDKLVDDFKEVPNDVAVISPKSIFHDGTLQSCGRPKHTIWTYILGCFHLWNEKKIMARKKNAKRVFKTFDIAGAFFLIKTNLFEKIGWFDEQYFFCPEDIVVSYKLRKLGYQCYVDADVVIIHNEGMSGNSTSMIKTATAPAAAKGSLIFYSHSVCFLNLVLAIITEITIIPNCIFHYLKGCKYQKPNKYYVLALSEINAIRSCFSRKNPKELFTYYYKEIKKNH